MDHEEQGSGVSMWERGLAPLKLRPGDAVKQEEAVRRGRLGAKAKKKPRFPFRDNPWALTPTQAVVMDMVVEGLTAKEIGEKLAISFKTVEVHKERVRDKMEARSCLRAAVLWDRFVRAGTRPCQG